MDDGTREFDAALGEVLAQFGRRVIDHPDMLRGALADTLGSTAPEHRAEMDAVVAASRVGVAGQIRDGGARAATPEEVHAWFDQLVEAGVALRDAALATRSWAEVLDASDTARITSELSEGLLSDDDRPGMAGRVTSSPSPAEGTPMTRFTPEEGATEMSDLSAFGDADRTVMPPLPERPAAQVVAPEPAAPAPADTTARQRDRKWPGYLPTVAAGLVTVLALAVGIPIIAANATPVTVPPFTPLDLEAPQVFARKDLYHFALTEEALAALVPGAASVVPPVYHGPDAYSLNFEAVDPACSPAFAIVSPADETSSGLFVSAAYDEANWLWVDSVSRWYETPLLAEEAILKLSTNPDALTPAPCTAPATSNAGNTFASTFAPADSVWLEGVRIERSTLTVASTPAWVHQRHCYVNRNIVTCVNVSGTGTAGLGSMSPGEALADGLDALFTQITPDRAAED